MRAGILGLIITFVSICIALFIIVEKSPNNIPTSQKKSTLPSQVKSYTNALHHFSFSYPVDFHLSESSNGGAITITNNEASSFIVQIAASTSGNIKKTPLQYILEICKGGSVTTKCSLDSQSVVTNSIGSTGSRYYLKKTQLMLKNIVGPFVSFSLPQNPPYMSGYIIFYPESLTVDDRSTVDFMTIINTITLPKISADIPPIGSSSAQ